MIDWDEDLAVRMAEQSRMSPGDAVVVCGSSEVLIVLGPPCQPRGKYDPWSLPVLSPTRGLTYVPITHLRLLPPGD
jgi:hypothetical protein